MIKAADGQIIKVLHIFGRMNRGGAEMRLLDIMRHLDRERYQLHFCALSGQPGELDNEIRALGGEVHLISLNKNFPQLFRQLLLLHQFDAVHSHVHYSSGFILRLAAKKGVAVRIAHFRSSSDGKGNNLRRRLQRHIMRYWIDQNATHILAVSQAAMTAAWKTNWKQDKRCQVIYNGIDLATFSGPPTRSQVEEEWCLPKGNILYIHIGRMDESKNHKKLLRIFAQIASKNPRSYLMLVGRGGNEIEQAVHAQVEELGVKDQILFAGERADVPRLLRAADLLIFPSIREGLPGIVLEACASGTPVLASDLSVIKEIAPQLPLIRYLSLSDSDEVWATTARNLGDRPRSESAREKAFQAFATSEFCIRDAVRAHCKVWQPKT